MIVRQMACILDSEWHFLYVEYLLSSGHVTIRNNKINSNQSKQQDHHDGVHWADTRGGTPSYKPYRYVSPHRVGFLRRFGLKTGIHQEFPGVTPPPPPPCRAATGWIET